MLRIDQFPLTIPARPNDALAMKFTYQPACQWVRMVDILGYFLGSGSLSLQTLDDEGQEGALPG
jgi:hypothetical protein